MTVLTSARDLHQWLAVRREASALDVRQVPLADCEEWSLDSEIRHRTGRFFQVVGVRVDEGPWRGWRQPMLRQEEIGILGFVVRRSGSQTQWLLQAKTEPGNVCGTQIAPTVQATRSNYTRIHGGSPTRHLEWFTTSRGAVVADVLASEQGTRFLNKRNRNVVVITDEPPAAGAAWCWADAATVRNALTGDFVVNTDARSVIVSAPWNLLADGGTAFSPAAGDSEFRRALCGSYATRPLPEPALAALAEWRAHHGRAGTAVPLQQLDGWNLDADGLTSATSDVSVRCFAVSAADREVTRWTQPLLSVQETACDLWCQQRDGQLKFLFRYILEPGLLAGVELGPTFQSDWGGAGPEPGGGLHVRISARQSDEGGRFFSCICRYRIVECDGPPLDAGRDHVWLTLSEIAALARQPMTFTNEARSAISLLLTLA